MWQFKMWFIDLMFAALIGPCALDAMMSGHSFASRVVSLVWVDLMLIGYIYMRDDLKKESSGR